MRTPTTVPALEDFTRIRLSPNFFVRDFLYSDIANLHGIPNLPADPDLFIAAGEQLCTQLLEPLNATFGRIEIRSAYRSEAVNDFGNKHDYGCAKNQANYAHHIWDRRDKQGHMGAMTSIVIPWFADQFEAGRSWTHLAWWIHDHLPYSSMFFFTKLGAFNLGWHEKPERRIASYKAPKGWLNNPGNPGVDDDHSALYGDFPPLRLS